MMFECPVCWGDCGTRDYFGDWDDCGACDGEGVCTLMQAVEWYATQAAIEADIDQLERDEGWIDA